MIIIIPIIREMPADAPVFVWTGPAPNGKLLAAYGAVHEGNLLGGTVQQGNLPEETLKAAERLREEANCSQEDILYYYYYYHYYYHYYYYY